MPERVETTDPDGVDFAWVMQTTFVLTILFGAPIVALVSIPVALPTWGARVSFAIRIGAIIWLVVACGAFLYERREVERRVANNGDSSDDRTNGARSTDHENQERNDHGNRETTDRNDGSADSGSQSTSERTSET